MDHVLLRGLFRLAPNKEAGDFDLMTNGLRLRLAEQVCALDQEALAEHPAANLQGLVTFVDSRAHFMVMQDSSGGIRVMQSRIFQSGRNTHPGMLVTVDGVAAMGDFRPSSPMPSCGKPEPRSCPRPL